MESKKHHNVWVRLLFVISALVLLSVAVNGQNTIRLDSIKNRKAQAVRLRTDLNNVSLYSIDKTLTSEYTKTDILTYTVDCVSTNTGTAYPGSDRTIGNDSLAVVSNYSFAIDNGTYIVEQVYYMWVNAAACTSFQLCVWNDYISAGYDNTSAMGDVPNWTDKFQFNARFQSYYLFGSSSLIEIGVLNDLGSVSLTGAGRPSYCKVVNGYLIATLFTVGACTPGADATYRIIFKMRKVN